MVALAGAATAGHAASTGPGSAVAELALGLLIGATAGGGGGWLVKVGRGRGWVAEGFAGAAVLFVGWFGPRGLASVVFGLLALEEVARSAAKPAVTVIAFTVLLSVVVHGLSADPLAKRYGPRLTPPSGAAGPAGLAEIPERRLIRRSSAGGPPGIPEGC